MKNRGLSFLLLYSLLPTGLVTVQNGLSMGELGVSLFLLLAQSSGIFLLFRIRSRRVCFRAGIVYLLILCLGSALGGFYINRNFYNLITIYYPGPFLTLFFILAQRYISRQAFEQLHRSLDQLIIMLLNYFLIQILINGKWFLDHPDIPPVILFPILYGSLNLIPAILYLIQLRKSFNSILKLNSSGVSFRNEVLDSLFNEKELLILETLLHSPQAQVCCRDIFPGNPECSQPEGCKASLCPQYSTVYRNVHTLGHKLESLGIGSLIARGNKREVQQNGWKLKLFQGVQIQGKDSSFSGGSVRMEKPVLETVQNFSSGRRLHGGPILLILVNFAFLLCEIRSYVTLPLSGWILILSGLLLIPLLPILCRKRTFIRGSIKFSLLVAVFTTVALIPFIGDERAAFLFLKIQSCFVIFLLGESGIPGENPAKDHLRKTLSKVLFWLIWFLMVSILVFRNPLNPSEGSGRELLSLIYLHDRLILVLLFAQSALFYALPIHYLEIRKDNFLLNGRELKMNLSKDNKNLFRTFLLAPEGQLHCFTIRSHLYPGESDSCREMCKPSSCSSYQKIYKRIRTLRYYLESAGIATIISPDRHGNVLEQGWQIQLYEDVRLGGDFFKQFY